MRTRQKLTELAHEAWIPYIKEAGHAIDATAGNGFDTEFLAKRVMQSGRVFAFDIQQSAIERTRLRLEEAGLLDRVTLVCADHAGMKNMIACGLRGQIDLICFNLGYLPNGDHSKPTSRESTMLALHESLLLLNDQGVLSVIAYRGHPGALEEAESVECFFRNLPRPWKCVRHLATGSDGNPGPVWWMASGR